MSMLEERETHTSPTLDTMKRLAHMDDVVVTAMDRTGMASLHQISRLRENYTEAAEKTPFGKIARVNQYSVVAELGKGSYGAVYLIEDDDATDEKRYYAMKSFPSSKATKPRSLARGPPGAAANHVDVVKMEIAIMKKLAHPNLVHLAEVIEETEAPYSLYLIMDYVDGGQVMSLKSGLPEGADPEFVAPSTGTVYGEAQASQLFRQLLSAMKYLHANRIAHRDLKPDNILISLDGQIKVTDFGVSNDFANETRLSRRNGFVTDTKGTWPYWAPEMCDEEMHQYNAFLADVWAAGVCLYVFLFGKLPFWGQSPDEIFQKILKLQTEPLEHPSRRSPEFVEMLDGMLVANPQQRPSFADCEQFAWIQQHSDEVIEQRLNSASSRIIDRDRESISLNNALTPGKVAFFSDRVNAKLSAWSKRATSKVSRRKSQSIEKVNIFIAESRIRTAAEIHGQEEEARRLNAPDVVQRSVFSQVLQHLKFEKDEAKSAHKMHFANVLGELNVDKKIKEQQKSVFQNVLQQFKFEKDVAKTEHKMQFANVLGELHSSQKSNVLDENEEEMTSPRSVFSQVLNQIQRMLPEKTDKPIVSDDKGTPLTTQESSLKSITTTSSDNPKLTRADSGVHAHKSRLSNVLTNIRNSITRQPSYDVKSIPVLRTDVIVDLADEITLPEREIKSTASSPRLPVQSENHDGDKDLDDKPTTMVSATSVSAPAACCVIS